MSILKPAEFSFLYLQRPNFIWVASCKSQCMFQDWQVFFPSSYSSSPVNQLGKVNELIIKPDLSELTEGKEDEDVVEQTVDKESKADSVFTATSFETALNLVITKRTSYEFSWTWTNWITDSKSLLVDSINNFSCFLT